MWLNMIMERKKQKLSQKELGEKVGINDVQISRIENGNQVPKLDTAIKIAWALDINLDYLLEDYKKELKSN